MPELLIAQSQELRSENARLRDELTRARAENARLRKENRQFRAALAAHVSRARSTAAFGPLELTAGTSVGPRHGRTRPERE